MTIEEWRNRYFFWRLDNITASGEIRYKMALVGVEVYISPIFFLGKIPNLVFEDLLLESVLKETEAVLL
jgi:hypothetical protein